MSDEQFLARPMALALEGVTFAYGPTSGALARRADLIARDVSLQMAPGEMTGLLGPNGAGKSTLLKLISGALRPQDGRVLVDGRDIRRMSREELARHVAVMPQDFGVQFNYTVRQVVELGRTPHLGSWGTLRARDRLAVNEALAETAMETFADRVFEDLSGGERQRALVALALAQEAPILLMDEPTAHLDIRYQVETLELLQRLNHERGLTVLATLHDLNLAARYFPRLIVYKRRIVADGAPTEALDEAILSEVYEMPVRVGILRGDERLSVLPPSHGSNDRASGPQTSSPLSSDTQPSQPSHPSQPSQPLQTAQPSHASAQSLQAVQSTLAQRSPASSSPHHGSRRERRLRHARDAHGAVPAPSSPRYQTPPLAQSSLPSQPSQPSQPLRVVRAAPRAAQASGPLRAHVLAGGGSGELLMRALADAGAAFSAGPLNVGDSDSVLAERLATLTLIEPPFTPISPEGLMAARERMIEAGVVVVCPAPLGPGNIALLDEALTAQRAGARVILLEPGFTHASHGGADPERQTSYDAVHPPVLDPAHEREMTRLAQVDARDFSSRGRAAYSALLVGGAVWAASPTMALRSALGGALA